MARDLQAWLKQHGRAETKLAKVLRKYFREQSDRVLKAAKDFDALTPSIVPQLFNVGDETELLIEAAGDPLLEFIATGAADVLEESKGPKQSKAFSLDDFTLPQAMKTAIEGAFAELMQQDYWREIQQATSESIQAVIQQGIEDGLSERKLASSLRSTFSTLGKSRAIAIARTESTGAFGAGHQASYETLAADGDISGKEWLAVSDQDTRQTHDDLNGKQVGATDSFDVGGTAAPYPGWHGLPASQRVRCRCTSAAVFV